CCNVHMANCFFYVSGLKSVYRCSHAGTHRLDSFVCIDTAQLNAQLDSCSGFEPTAVRARVLSCIPCPFTETLTHGQPSFVACCQQDNGTCYPARDEVQHIIQARRGKAKL